MAEYGALTHCGIFVSGYDMSGDCNAVTGAITSDIRDRSCFGDTARVRAYGLEDMAIALAGLLNIGENEQDQISREAWRDNTALPISIFIPSASGAAAAVGDFAYFFSAMQPQYTIGGQHGQDALFTMNAQNNSLLAYPVGIGYVLNPGVAAVTEDGNTAGTNKPGAVAAGQYLYAILHVTEVSAGDSIVVTVESATTDEFLPPTTRVTFSSFNAVGAEIQTRVAGPITDTYWRAVHNVTGEGVVIKYACAIAIR